MAGKGRAHTHEAAKQQYPAHFRFRICKSSKDWGEESINISNQSDHVTSIWYRLCRIVLLLSPRSARSSYNWLGMEISFVRALTKLEHLF